jgi:hypothetical protein
MPDDLTFPIKQPSSHANRHTWALEKHGHLLAEALCKDTSPDAREVEKLPEERIPDRLVSLILAKADPTRNKGMTAWLVGQYAHGKLRLEDLGTANETLMMFRRYAQRLEKRQRDLGRYPSLAAVWEAVIGFANAEEQHISGKAQKALEQDKAYAESRILRQDPDGFTIAVPLTEFAAKWWGRGTRWCTAAKKDNAFLEYHEEAPLIVIVIPELKGKGKFQIWATEDDVQFMDATDEEVAVTVTEANWGRFEPIIQAALMQNGWALKWVPEHLRTEELCEIAVERTGVALLFVPESLRSKELCRIAVTQDGCALEYVPVQLRNLEICKIAIEKNGLMLGYVPLDLQTLELCRIAVGQNGWALSGCPKPLRTSDLCRIAVEKNGIALMYVAEPLRTPELFRIAIAQVGEALQHLPGALRTPELCRIAVSQDGNALCWVPEHLRTDELCRIAVAQDGGALRYVPNDRRTADLCKIAVAQNGLALNWVLERLKTVDLCRIAVQNSFSAMECVPPELKAEMPARPEEKASTPIWPIRLLDDLERAMAEKLPLIVQNPLCLLPNDS